MEQSRSAQDVGSDDRLLRRELIALGREAALIFRIDGLAIRRGKHLPVTCAFSNQLIAESGRRSNKNEMRYAVGMARRKIHSEEAVARMTEQHDLVELDGVEEIAE